MIGVTKLIDILNKPHLVYWANKIGLNGLNINDYRSESTKKGTSKHKEIENYIKYNKPFVGSSNLNLLISGYDIIGSEYKIHNNHIIGYCDLVISNGDKKIIIDFKSNSNIYLNHKLQLSTYKEIYGADEIWIVNFNSWKKTKLDIDTKKYYEIIKRLYQINTLLKELNEKL